MNIFHIQRIIFAFLLIERSVSGWSIGDLFGGDDVVDEWGDKPAEPESSDPQIIRDMISNMDRTVEPCDNFIGYACGNYGDPYSSSAVQDQFSASSDLIYGRLRDEIHHGTKFTTAEQKAVDYIRTCEKQTRGQLGVKPYKDMLREHFGKGYGWRVLPEYDFDARHWDLTTALLKHSKLFNKALFNFKVMSNFFENAPNVFFMGTAPKMDEEITINSTFSTYGRYDDLFGDLYGSYRRKSYLDYFGVKDTRALSEITTAVSSVTSRIQNAITPLLTRYRTKDTYYEVLTIQKLESRCPQINWLVYLNGLVESAGKSFDRDTKIMVAPSHYLEALCDQVFRPLMRYTSGRRQLHDYLHYKLLQKMSRHLDVNLHRTMTGADTHIDHDGCLNKATDLKFLLTSIYIKNHFKPETRKKAEDMMENLREAFRDNIKSATWIDDRTRQEARNKLDKLSFEIGYPKAYVNDDYLEKSYANLEIRKDEHFFNRIQLYKWRLRNEFIGLNELTDITWTSDGYAKNPLASNAMYQPMANNVLVQLGTLVPPFFSPSYPTSINYGKIGAILGHELTHGFDPQGSEFDADGNFRNWWSYSTKREFLQREQCFVGAFNRLRFLGNPVSGIRTLGENVADSGGLAEAFLAYKKEINKSGEDKRLHGLPDLNHDQLYFLGYAQNWCQKIDPRYRDYFARTLLSDVHAPPEIRILGTLRHSRKFSQVFQCRPGQTYSAINKCKLW